MLDGLEERELKVEVVGESRPGECCQRIPLPFRRVTGGVTQIVRERFFALGIFLNVAEQKFARLGTGNGDGDIRKRPRVLLAQVFFHQTRQHAVGFELVPQRLAKDINEVRVGAVSL